MLDLSSTKTFLAELRSPPVPQKRLPIPKRLIERVEELLKDNPAGLWVSRFPMEFKVWKYSQRMFQNERVKLRFYNQGGSVFVWGKGEDCRMECGLE